MAQPWPRLPRAKLQLDTRLFTFVTFGFAAAGDNPFYSSHG